MKIRTGFVSNSSSSSFCLLCTTLESIEAKNPDVDVKYDEFCKWGTNKGLLTGKIEIGAWDYSEADKFIGAEPWSMEDGETLMQFKERICAAFAEKGVQVVPEDLSWEVQGGYDG